MHKLARLDHRYVWHPFTQMREWLRDEPITIVRGEGTVLRDVHGRGYLDANASIWTNLHGHNHPRLNAAIERQLRKIAHSSALGLANEPASILARDLVESARLAPARLTAGADVHPPPSRSQQPRLAKVFFSDDGSTAIEVALKLAYEVARRRGCRRPAFLSLAGAYHGDTVGAVSLGHIPLFHAAYAGLRFKCDRVMAPYCYRCPFNRARPERADARAYRDCRWECVDQVERAFQRQAKRGQTYAALAVEPMIQGAAGMIPQPAGWLRRTAEIARTHHSLLIADEILTAFGRAGARGGLFASHDEAVQPDLLCLAKGLTGGYLAMGATLATRPVFDAFLGEYAEFKTFFHGHSYTGNQLAAAAALASLRLLKTRASRRARIRLARHLRSSLESLWTFPNVGDIRQVGTIAAIELVRDWKTRAPFDLRERVGAQVCAQMARRGVLTRPIGNVIVLMPPFCASPRQVEQMVGALAESLESLWTVSRRRSVSRL